MANGIRLSWYRASDYFAGTLCDFRHRLIKHNLDVSLLEQTVEVAKKVGGFCYKQLRIALDSAPLAGAGRVEDAFNLIGHALELLVDCAAQIKQVSADEIIKEAGTKLMGQTSIKAALDIDWSDAQEKRNAINTLLNDVDALRLWLNKQPASLTNNRYLKEALLLLETVLTQNIELDHKLILATCVRPANEPEHCDDYEFTYRHEFGCVNLNHSPL